MGGTARLSTRSIVATHIKTIIRLTVTSEGPAGIFYFQVPVKLIATHADASKYICVGCHIVKQPNS